MFVKHWSVLRFRTIWLSIMCIFQISEKKTSKMHFKAFLLLHFISASSTIIHIFKRTFSKWFFPPLRQNLQTPKLSFIPKYILKFFIELFVHIIRLIFIDPTLSRLFVDFNYNTYFLKMSFSTTAALICTIFWRILLRDFFIYHFSDSIFIQFFMLKMHFSVCRLYFLIHKNVQPVFIQCLDLISGEYMEIIAYLNISLPVTCNTHKRFAILNAINQL